MYKGFVKFHREIIGSAAWRLSSPQTKAVMVTLMTMANFEEKEWLWAGRPIRLRPGQMVTSLEAIADASGKGISVRNVRTALSMLEKTGFLTNEPTKAGRRITILKYDENSADDSQPGRPDDRPGDKGPANRRQTADRPAAPTKELKKERMKKTKEISSGPAGSFSSEPEKVQRRLLAVCSRLALRTGDGLPVFPRAHDFVRTMLQRKLRADAVADALEQLAESPGVRNPWSWAEKVALIRSQNLNEAEAAARHDDARKEPINWQALLDYLEAKSSRGRQTRDGGAPPERVCWGMDDALPNQPPDRRAAYGPERRISEFRPVL